MSDKPEEKIDPGIIATGKLFDALAKDPRYRSKVLSLVKEAAPETPIPELDLREGITKEIEARFKPREDELTKTKERLDAVERRLSREAWAKQHNLDDAEVVEVEEFAKEHGIAKAESAVKLFEQARSASGTPRSTRKTMPGTAEYLEKLSKVNPRNVNALKRLALPEATRIITGRRAE